MGTKIDLYQQQNDLLIDSFDDIILKVMQKRNNGKLKTLLFCGSEPGVGTTTVTINMAVSLAQGQNKTLLIDSDMRKSAKQKRLSQTPPFGLSDFFESRATQIEIINKTNINNLDYIACGTPTSQSTKTLKLNNLTVLLSSLEKNYDFILFDSPSLDVVNDATILSILADGIFLICELGKTTKSNINKMIQTFSESKKILGMLINKVDQPEYRMYIRNYDYFQKKRTQLI